MTMNIRLVLPGLFEPHMLQVMEPETKALHDQLLGQLSKADRLSCGEDVYQSLYQLGPEHLQYTPWLVNTEVARSSHFLRADPVILEPTHNGIVCRGNDILHLAQDEQDEIAQLFNDYFQERGLSLSFLSPSEAVVELTDASIIDASFSSLAEVLGQDITHHLPTGSAGRTWQTILMETQMLLARSETNLQRSDQGEKTVGSLWFWGKTAEPSTSGDLSRSLIFTDHPVLQSAFADKSKPLTEFSLDAETDNEIDVFSQRLELACIQNDPQSWQSGFRYCYENYLAPVIKASKSGDIAALEVITESEHYRLKPWHRLRFWR